MTTRDPDSERSDHESLIFLRNLGYQVSDIQSIAREQRPFAVRVSPYSHHPGPGVHLTAKPVELGHGRFTNDFSLTVDLDQAAVKAVSAVNRFCLPQLMAPGKVIAAVSGSFSYISDDPYYQPAEPCLDFCCRSGRMASLPTADKPAFAVYDGQPLITRLSASGVLLAGRRPFRWLGSKEPYGATQADVLRVYGAANCRVEYADDDRTGFVRFVDPTGNLTPREPSALDCVVSCSGASGQVISSVHAGGGADLFAGSFVLRADRSHADSLRVGTPIRVTHIAGLEADRLACGMSIGPSVADAALGNTAAYDNSLGMSPFRDTQYARALVMIEGRELSFRIFDGAPLAESFRGLSPRETADLLAAEGLPADRVYHLDGGQSSKLAFRAAGEAVTVAGSMHYLRWPRDRTAPFRWRGFEGRPLNSCFVVERPQ